MFFLKPFPSLSTRNLALACALLCSGIAHAEIINHEWVGGDGNWGTKTNWNPSPAATIGSNQASAFDRVTIDGSVTVTHTGSISFYGVDTNGNGAKAGTFNALTLKNGATLNITGNFRVSTASGNPNAATRNVQIDAGTSLIVSGDITSGAQNSATAHSTWAVRGQVEAKRFLGQQSTSSNSAINGGFILNIDGGSFKITESFDFKSSGGTLANLTGKINLSNNGIFTVGQLLNWTGSSENYINFADGSGAFTFSHSEWTTKADVEQLIKRGFIRKGDTVSGDFNIIDTGTAWQISIDAIPEPSTYALIAFSAGTAILLRKKAESLRD